MLLSLVCVIVGQPESSLVVEIDDLETGCDLKDMIKEKKNGDITVPAMALHLLLAKKNTMTEESGGGGGEYLNRADAAAVALDVDGYLGEGCDYERMDPTLFLKNAKLFGDNFAPKEGQVHVLVVVPQQQRDESASSLIMPPLKRVKLPVQKHVAHQGPVDVECFSVPMETIDAYQKLQMAFLSSRRRRAPGGPQEAAALRLLYWPCQFGKTTIGYRLCDLLMDDPSVVIIFRPLNPIIVQTEQTFWHALGKTIGKATKCSQDFERMFFGRNNKRLWLVLDEMDALLTNTQLTRHFMDCLCAWQTNPQFLGFLGIGSHALVDFVKGGIKSPFEATDMVPVQRFSCQQMGGVFRLIKRLYSFPESTQEAMMAYSSGVPGVFGSMIRYSIDFHKWDQKRPEWEQWFKIQRFSLYIDNYNGGYKSIRNDLLGTK